MNNKSFNLFQTPDGSVMDVYVTYPEGTLIYPAIILLNEGFGVNAHMRSVAERLCNEGYAVFIPDLFHRNGRQNAIRLWRFIPLATLPYIESVTTESLLMDLKITFIALQSMRNVNREKVGALGFGYGGRYSYLANSWLPLSAGVSFYGIGIDKILTGSREQHSPHLFFWGGRDRNTSNAQVGRIGEALSSKEKQYTSVVISYADHGFFSDERSSYHPLAARQAWAQTLAFFDFLLK